MLERLFHLKEHGVTARTEIIAGCTTFLAIAYILAVNPTILGSVMDKNGVFMATAIASATATFIMGFLANYPIALSAGMGLNAYFAYTVCLGELGGAENAFRVALTAVLTEGIIFILLSVVKAREHIINGIPQNLKYGITAGIGLFIALIGLIGAHISAPDSSTIITLGDFSEPNVVLALVGVVVIVVLSHFRIKGAVLLGIVVTWIFGMLAEAAGWYVVDTGAGVNSVFPSFTGGLNLGGLANTAFKFDFSWAADHIVHFIAILFSFLFVDLFDTVGTVVGVAEKAGLIDEEGKIPRVGKIFLSDAIGTTVGACLGTSTITSCAESNAGVSAGGKTGLTAVTTGVLFLAAIFLSPVFIAVPSFATAPVLIYVGMIMMSSAAKIRFDGDLADVLGAYLAILMMPMTYSIANGIMFAALAWVLVKVFTGKAKDVSTVMWVVFVLFILRIVALGMNFQ